MITNHKKFNEIESGLLRYLIDHIREYKATPIVIVALITAIKMYPI
jgi:hypothetical protein